MHSIFQTIIAVLMLASNLSGGANKIVISGDLELYQISENCYIHTSYADIPGYSRVPANGLVYIAGDKALLVETAWNDSLTQQLLDYVKSNMGLTVEAVIPTHWHEDCLGGLQAAHQAGVKSYALEQTLALCKDNEKPLPQNGFQDSVSVALNGKTVFAYYAGAGHTMDNIVVFIPDGAILFGGCAVKSLGAKGMGNIADADLQQWPVTLNAILQKFPQSKIVVPGHGSAGDLALIRHTLDLLKQAAE